MENFGIVFSVPAAFVLTAVYAGVVGRFATNSTKLWRFILAASWLILVALVLELALLLAVAPKRVIAFWASCFQERICWSSSWAFRPSQTLPSCVSVGNGTQLPQPAPHSPLCWF